MELYDFQKDLLSEVKSHFKTNKTVCLSAYTGSGKTNVFCQLIIDTLKANPKAKIGVSAYFTTEIREQVFERLQTFSSNIDILELGPNEFNKDDEVFVFNPQYFNYNEHKGLKFDLLVIDESHYGLKPNTKMLNNIMKNYVKRGGKILLVSATPWDMLAIKEFQKIPVVKRTIQDGIKDQMLADCSIITEEAQVSFKPEDYTRDGELKEQVIRNKIKVIKSACIGKMKNLIKKYGDDLGEKVIVICPPGNTGEIAREMAEEFKGLAYLEVSSGRRIGENYKYNLEQFQKNKDVRFLFVVYKCTCGFDFKKLGTVIDLTMTKNFKTVIQRMGRVARRYRGIDKKYIYVYDKARKEHEIAWFVMTILDLSLGFFDGLTSRDIKYRPVRVRKRQDYFRFKSYSGKFSEIIAELSKAKQMKTSIDLTLVDYKKPRVLTLSTAKEIAKNYENRHDLFKKDPSLYKWFRLNCIDELNKIHPLMKKQGKWNEKTVTAAMKKCVKKGRKYFYKTYPGASDWILKNNRQELRDEIFGPLKKNSSLWSYQVVQDTLMGIDQWSEIRNYSGLRHAIRTHMGGEYKMKQWWLKHRFQEDV